MAKRKVNKSEMVREVLAANPSATVKEVMTILESKGVEISYQAAYTAKKKAEANGTAPNLFNPTTRATKAAPVAAPVGKDEKAGFADTMDRIYDLIDRLGAKQLANIVDRIAAREEGSIARQELHG